MTIGNVVIKRDALKHQNISQILQLLSWLCSEKTDIMKNSIIILFCATLTINYSSCFPSNNIEIDKRIVGG